MTQTSPNTGPPQLPTLRLPSGVCPSPNSGRSPEWKIQTPSFLGAQMLPAKGSSAPAALTGVKLMPTAPMLPRDAARRSGQSAPASPVNFLMPRLICQKSGALARCRQGPFHAIRRRSQGIANWRSPRPPGQTPGPEMNAVQQPNRAPIDAWALPHSRGKASQRPDSLRSPHRKLAR